MPLSPLQGLARLASAMARRAAQSPTKGAYMPELTVPTVAPVLVTGATG